jgi:putative ABC transport system permease protein
MQPLHHAVLQVTRNPRSSLTAIGIIGLAIGASVGIGAIVDRAVLRPLPYSEPDRLVVVFNTYPQWRTREVLSRFWDRIDLSWPEYATLRDRGDVFRNLAIHTAGEAVYRTEDQAEVIQAGLATHELLPVLGISPVLGRWFVESDDVRGAAPVAVLSHDFWRSRFGGDSNVVGRVIAMDSARYTVVGVLPPAFAFQRVEDARPPQVWIALSRMADPLNEGSHAFRAVGRLRDGVSLAEALGAATAVLRGDRPPETRSARILSREEYERGGARPVMRLFAAAAVVLLLLACATVAALQLARTVARSREVAVRAAVGASSQRIAMQLLLENVIIGLAGGVVGIVLARGTIGALAQLLPPDTPGVADAAVDGRVLVLTLLLSLGSAVLFGFAPALRAVRSNPARDLMQARSSPRAPALLVLVGVQSALAVLLIVGAGLLVRTVHALNAVDPGFVTSHRLTFAVQLPSERYTPTTSHEWLNDLASRLRATPGVLTVAGTSVLPLSGSSTTNSVWLESSGPETGPKPEVERRIVTPEYFRALRVPLRQGRMFLDTDDGTSERVMVVSRSASLQLWRGRNPIGDRVEMSNEWWRVVGVVEDVLDRTLEADVAATVYVPAAQRQPLGRQFVIETAQAPLQLAPVVRALVRSMDAAVPVRDLRSLDDVVAASMQPQLARAVLVAGYAFVAALLAVVGLYGVTSYGANRRTREFAIRSALGARTWYIVLLAMRQSVRASLYGIIAGVGIAFVLTHALREFLFGVAPADPLTFALSAIGLTAVATLASALSALGAARVDPVRHLRRD